MDRPAHVDISCWIWYDKQNHADLELWQNSLLAAYNAEAKDLHDAATKIYLRLGGQLKAKKPPRRKGKVIRFGPAAGRTTR